MVVPTGEGVEAVQSADRAYYVPYARDFEGRRTVSPTERGIIIFCFWGGGSVRGVRRGVVRRRWGYLRRGVRA